MHQPQAPARDNVVAFPTPQVRQVEQSEAILVVYQGEATFYRDPKALETAILENIARRNARAVAEAGGVVVYTSGGATVLFEGRTPAPEPAPASPARRRVDPGDVWAWGALVFIVAFAVALGVRAQAMGLVP